MFASSDHNENIFNIIPPKFQSMPKQPMHRSSSSGKLPPTASTFHQYKGGLPSNSNIAGDAVGKPVTDKAHAGFGMQMGSYKNNPNAYMKKMAKSYSVPGLAEVKRTNPDQLKPKTLHPSSKAGGGPPRRDEIPVMNLVTSKNFIVANAVETILAAPKKVTEGAKDYLKKEDYGKVPKYLNHIRNDIEAEYDYIRQLEQQRMDDDGPQVRDMDEQERQHIINGLKAKWESVNTDYQGGTHVTSLDTMGKKKRKEKHEAELAQIEKDIEKMSKRGIHIDQNA